MTVALQSLQSSASRGLNLSLLKVGPLVQVTVGAIVTALVLVATATTFTVVITRSQFTPPSPVNDEYTITKADLPAFNVLDNDKDEKEQDKLYISAVTQPLFGKASISKDKKQILYQPAPRFAGTVEFEYTCSNSKLSAKAKVVVHITNHAPEAVDHWQEISKNSYDNKLNVVTEVNKNGLKCTDVDPGEVLTILEISKPPTRGIAKFEHDTILYTPFTNNMEDDQLEYVITDGNDTAKANVYYKIRNDPPQAKPDHYKIPMNTLGNFDVLENDEDKNLDPLKITFVGYRGVGTLRHVVENEGELTERHYLQYLPPMGFVGSESFEYTITDGAETSSTYGTIVVVNTKPEADSFSVEVPKNAQDFVIPDFNTKFRDADVGTTLTVKIIGGLQNPQGSYSLTHTEKTETFEYLGLITKSYTVKIYELKFTPAPGQVYTDTLTYEVSDGIDTATATITLNVGNTPPVAVDDVAECEKNKEVIINVIENDSDPNGDDIFVKSVSIQSGKGTATVHSASSVRYVPPQNQVGPFTFTYTIEDIQNDPTHARTAQATVTVNVVNSPPVPVDDEFTVPKGLETNLDVLANDVDPNGDKLTVVNVGQTDSEQVVTIVQEGGVTKVKYPALNQIYTDTFTYEVSDGEFTRTATVRVYVVNTPPVPHDDSATVHWRDNVVIDVLANDEDINPGDKSKLKIASVDDSLQATIEVINNKIRYTPPEGFGVGTAQFTYKIKDDYDESQTSATVTVTVTNSPPVVPAQQREQLRNTVQTYDLAPLASDPNGDPVYLKEISQQPAEGTASVVNGKLRFAAGNTPSTQTIKYKISDSVHDTEGTLTVIVGNIPPVADDDHFSFFASDIDMEAGVELDVLANDNNGDDIKIKTIDSQTANVEVTTTADQKKIIYKRNPGFLGTDTFTYTITDGFDDSNPATVTVTISQQPPSVPNTVDEISWNSGAKQYNLLQGATGEEVELVSITSSSYGVHSFVGDPKNGVVSYTPLSDLPLRENNGRLELVDQMSFVVKDKYNQESSAMLIITIYNNKPVAKPDILEFAKTAANPEKSVNVTNNDEDDEPLSIAAGSVKYTGEGFVAVSGDSLSIRYKPKQGWSGEEIIKYKATDGQAESDETTVTVVVTNDPPECGNVIKNIEKGSSYTWDLKADAGCTDANGDALSLSLPANVDQAKGTVEMSGQNVKYTHKALRSGQHLFQFTVSDGTDSTTRTVTVNIPNNAPTCSNIARTFNKGIDAVHTISIQDHCHDDDAHDVLTVKSLSFPDSCLNGGAGGQLSIVNGELRFAPKNGWAGTCSAQFTVGDSDVDNEKTTTATVTITVINNLPVAVDDVVQSPQGTDAVIPISVILNNDYDLDVGDEIEFVSFDNTCYEQGLCHNRPYLSGSNIVVPSDPQNCDADKFTYKIRTVGDNSYEATATVTVEWIDCTCYAPIDVMFVVDGSLSITGQNWIQLKSFVQNVADRFVISPDQVNVALIQFSAYPKVEFSFKSDQDEVRTLIGEVDQMQKWTGTVGGLELAHNYTLAHGRDGVNKVIVLIADGKSNLPHHCGKSSGTYDGGFWGKDSTTNILTCKMHYGGVDHKNKCKSPFYPGLTCDNCNSDTPMPCADPWKVCSVINKLKKADGAASKNANWKVVALGIGDELLLDDEYGWKQIKGCSYDESKARQVAWADLDDVVNTIVDVSCNQNS